MFVAVVVVAACDDGVAEVEEIAKGEAEVDVDSVEFASPIPVAAPASSLPPVEAVAKKLGVTDRTVSRAILLLLLLPPPSPLLLLLLLLLLLASIPPAT